MGRLAEHMAHLTEEVQSLAEAQHRTEAQLVTLTEIVQRISVDVGRLKGDGLEVRYTLRGVPSITRALRRPVPLSTGELDALLRRGRNPRSALRGGERGDCQGRPG